MSSSSSDGELEQRLELLLDTPRFGPVDIAFVAGVSDRTVQRRLREADPHHVGPWRVTRAAMMKWARELAPRPRQMARAPGVATNALHGAVPPDCAGVAVDAMEMANQDEKEA